MCGVDFQNSLDRIRKWKGSFTNRNGNYPISGHCSLSISPGNRKSVFAMVPGGIGIDDRPEEG